MATVDGRDTSLPARTAGPQWVVGAAMLASILHWLTPASVHSRHWVHVAFLRVPYATWARAAVGTGLCREQGAGPAPAGPTESRISSTHPYIAKERSS